MGTPRSKLVILLLPCPGTSHATEHTNTAGPGPSVDSGQVPVTFCPPHLALCSFPWDFVVGTPGCLFRDPTSTSSGTPSVSFYKGTQAQGYKGTQVQGTKVQGYEGANAHQCTPGPTPCTGWSLAYPHSPQRTLTPTCRGLRAPNLALPFLHHGLCALLGAAPAGVSWRRLRLELSAAACARGTWQRRRPSEPCWPRPQRSSSARCTTCSPRGPSKQTPRSAHPPALLGWCFSVPHFS